MALPGLHCGFTQSSIRPGLSCNYIFFMWIRSEKASSQERDEGRSAHWNMGWLEKEKSKGGFFSPVPLNTWDMRKWETEMMMGAAGGPFVVSPLTMDRQDFICALGLFGIFSIVDVPPLNHKYSHWSQSMYKHTTIAKEYVHWVLIRVVLFIIVLWFWDRLPYLASDTSSFESHCTRKGRQWHTWMRKCFILFCQEKETA